MRALVVADVHANLEAFQAVLDDAAADGGFEAIWCLGDIVGYGAEPEECIRLLRGFPNVMVAGNHDRAALDLSLAAAFNPYAAEAVRWTAGRLSDETKQWLRSLPEVTVAGEAFTLTHGSLTDPIWKYLVSAGDAEEHLGLQQTPYGFVGHSHLPFVFREGERSVAVTGGDVALDWTRFVANPGSAGQPRDGNPRAAYAIVDTDTGRMSLRRVEYDIASAQRKILDAGLPEVLATRLAAGR